MQYPAQVPGTAKGAGGGVVRRELKRLDLGTGCVSWVKVRAWMWCCQASCQDWVNNLLNQHQTLGICLEKLSKYNLICIVVLLVHTSTAPLNILSGTDCKKAVFLGQCV